MAKRKKIFFDVEFTGLHKLTTPISVALVDEDGKAYYAEFTDYDELQIDDFLRASVLSKLILEDYDFEKHYDPDGDIVYVKGETELIKETLTAWLEKYKEAGVEMWGDCLAYDWVLFVSIFGNAFDVPKQIHYIPMDLCTALKLMKEDPDVDREIFAYGEEQAKKDAENKHNSLWDAQTQLEVFKKLLNKGKTEKKEEGKEEETEEEAPEQVEEEVVTNINEEQAEVTEEVEQEQVEEEVVEEEESVEEAQPEEEQEMQAEEIDPEEVIEEVTEEAVSSDVNSGNNAFVEPTQEEVNKGGEEWTPPL